MANSVLDGFLTGFFGSDGYMRDFRHASRLYRDDNLYDLAPKAGWLYYVRLKINPEIRNLLDPTWAERYSKFVGLMAKEAELPRFLISTETLNQYNKKTVIQNKITYSPVTITFHDDMANATTELWRNYYQYYYADGVYGQNNFGNKIPVEYTDNVKYNDSISPYGLANGIDKRFFSAIEIYLLNKKKFSSITLVNPMIKEWSHGQVQQMGNQLLESKMTVEYESVFYDKGKTRLLQINDEHYDKKPSPLSIAGGGILGIAGVVGGASEIFGEDGLFSNANSPLDVAKAVFATANLVKNANKLTAADATRYGYSVLGSPLANFANRGDTPAPISGKLPSGNNARVNLYKYPNKSVDGSISAKPSNVTGTNRS